jgi:ribosome-associated protein
MTEFHLTTHEFIELNKLLKLLRLVGSGGEANNAIVSEMVKVNNTVEIQKRKKLRVGDKIEFNGTTIIIV